MSRATSKSRAERLGVARAALSPTATRAGRNRRARLSSHVGRVLALVLVVGLLATVLTPLPAGAEDGPVRYITPVDAPVVDGFRPPPGPYGAGNRGLEYDTTPGQPVHAAASGEVIFAGAVADALHVTVLHRDGRKSSYSFLASVSVSIGDEVAGGDVVGTAADRLHVGVREGDTYVDPAALFGTEVRSVHLVPENPVGGATWERTAREVQALALLTAFEGGPGIFDRLGGAASSLWDHAMAVAPDLLDLALWVSREIAFAANPVLAIVVFDLMIPLARGQESPLWEALKEWSPHHLLVRTVERGIDWWHQRSHCTPSDVAPPQPDERRVAVLVGGLGSTSSDASVGALDVDELGYAPGDVIGYSYAGGRIPGTFDGGPMEVSPDLAGLDVAGYGVADSTSDLAARGQHLADLLIEVAASSPGTPIDLYGHSQGGVVLRLALAELGRRPGGVEVIASLGLVATMGTPHQGSDLATAALVAAGTGEGLILLAGAHELTGAPVDPSRASNLEDLALASELIVDLERTGLPTGPTYLSLAARGDLVVPDTRAELEGATNVTLPITGITAHGELPGHASTTRELALALAGMDPTCESVWDALVDGVVSEGTHEAHVRIGAVAAIGESFSQLPTWVGEAVAG